MLVRPLLFGYKWLYFGINRIIYQTQCEMLASVFIETVALVLKNSNAQNVKIPRLASHRRSLCWGWFRRVVVHWVVVGWYALNSLSPGWVTALRFHCLHEGSARPHCLADGGFALFTPVSAFPSYFMNHSIITVWKRDSHLVSWVSYVCTSETILKLSYWKLRAHVCFDKSYLTLTCMYILQV